MNDDEFLRDLQWLAAQYEKPLTPELIEALWRELRASDAADWADAVRDVARDYRQRSWPRLGQLLQAVADAAARRRDRDWHRTKGEERVAVRAFLTGDALTDAQGRIKALIGTLARPTAEERTRFFAALRAEFLAAAATDAAAGCPCEDGLVVVTRRRQEWEDTVT